MNRLIVVLALVAGASYLYIDGGASAADAVGPQLEAVVGPRERSVTFEYVAASGAAFAELAKPESYTIVFVTSDTCPPCRVLDKHLVGFLEARPDVVVVRVTTPSGRQSFASQAEAESWMGRQRAVNERYGVAGTPHIEIFGPDGQAIAQDGNGSSAGRDALGQWMTAELSQSE